MGTRVMFQPFIGISGAVITASSAETAFPARRLRDPQPAAKWRSLTGWNIVAGFNDELDFTEGTTGDATATITAGNYETGAELATAVQTALNAAATDNTYTVTYSTSTFKFTIARNVGSDTFGLKWDTGSSTASIGIDLGFDVSADDTGSTSYAADSVAHHSREFVMFQLGTASTGAFAAAMNHNFDSDATVTVMGNSSDSWASPGTSTALVAATGELPIRSAFFTEATYAYWRIEIDDVQNVDGFSEFSLFHVSNFIEPAYDMRAQWSEDREELSEIGMADQGGTFVNLKPTRSAWKIVWPAISESEKSNSIDPWLNFVRAGRPFFWAPEPDSDTTFVRYVMLTQGARFSRVPGAGVWQLAVNFEEVLP